MGKVSKTHSAILVGDINIDVNINNATTHCQEYTELLSSLSYRNIINKPTRIAQVNLNISKTTINHIITNTPLNLAQSGILTYDISDHLPILITFDDSQQVEGDRRSYVNLKAANWSGFRSAVEVKLAKRQASRKFQQDFE